LIKSTFNDVHSELGQLEKGQDPYILLRSEKIKAALDKIKKQIKSSELTPEALADFKKVIE